MRTIAPSQWTQGTQERLRTFPHRFALVRPLHRLGSSRRARAAPNTTGQPDHRTPAESLAAHHLGLSSASVVKTGSPEAYATPAGWQDRGRTARRCSGRARQRGRPGAGPGRGRGRKEDIRCASPENAKKLRSLMPCSATRGAASPALADGFSHAVISALWHRARREQ